MTKYILPTLVAIAALALAGIAAFYSITGMTKFFTGVATPIIIMMAGIEFGKLVLASVVHRNWKDLKAWRWISIVFIVVVMFITSLGVFGFLSAAYDRTVAKLNVADGAIALEESKKPVLEGKIASYESAIERKTDRINTLNQLRDEQEVRLDSLYARGWHSTARKTRESIAQQNREISTLDAEVDSLSNQIQGVYTEIATIDSTVVMLANDATQGEIGAVKYFAQAIKSDRDKAAFIVIYALIFVCDPMAVTLVFLFNIVLDKARRKEDEDELVVTKEKNPESEQGPEPESEQGPEQELEPESEQESKPQLLISDPAKFDWKIKEPEEKSKDPEPEVEIKTKIDIEKLREVLASDDIDDEFAQALEKHRPIYIGLIEPLYDGGTLGVGDKMGSHEEFSERIKKYNMKVSDQTIQDFLFSCTMFRIIKWSSGDNAILLKSKNTAKMIMEIL